VEAALLRSNRSREVVVRRRAGAEFVEKLTWVAQLEQTGLSP
jgi:hypothetical protein